MVQYLQVEDKQDLVRDTSSNAIVNRNRNAYEIAKKRAEDAQRQRDEIRTATREINTLKCEMHEIKNMLTELINR
tara:strand:+ start:1426 stop:1650 length:225 start_codon:yes stop_codon:yes gene_type:complete